MTVLIFCFLMLSACDTQQALVQQNSKTNQSSAMMPGPATFIYKTKKDYRDKVPVMLTDDKTKVRAYPDPKDLKTKGKFAYPTQLEQGFLLDNQGINNNVAFLSLTYEEYAALSQKPDAATVLKMVLDADPLTELFYCGSRVQYEETTIAEQLNKVIRQNKMEQKFQRVK